MDRVRKRSCFDLLAQCFALGYRLRINRRARAEATFFNEGGLLDDQRYIGGSHTKTTVADDNLLSRFCLSDRFPLAAFDLINARFLAAGMIF